MHPTAELRKEMAELKAELATLKAKLAPNPAIAAAEAAEEVAIIRQRRLAEAEAEGRRRFDLWKAEQQAKIEAEQAQALRKMTEGLPPGQFRDASGFVRDKDGQRVEAKEHQRADLETVMRIQADEHRAWKISERLPVRPTTPTEAPEGD